MEVYHGDPDAPENSHEFSQYEAGVRMGSLGAALLNASLLLSLLLLLLFIVNFLLVAVNNANLF